MGTTLSNLTPESRTFQSEVSVTHKPVSDLKYYSLSIPNQEMAPISDLQSSINTGLTTKLINYNTHDKVMKGPINSDLFIETPNKYFNSMNKSIHLTSKSQAFSLRRFTILSNLIHKTKSNDNNPLDFKLSNQLQKPQNPIAVTTYNSSNMSNLNSKSIRQKEIHEAIGGSTNEIPNYHHHNHYHHNQYEHVPGQLPQKQKLRNSNSGHANYDEFVNRMNRTHLRSDRKSMCFIQTPYQTSKEICWNQFEQVPNCEYDSCIPNLIRQRRKNSEPNNHSQCFAHSKYCPNIYSHCPRNQDTMLTYGPSLIDLRHLDKYQHLPTHLNELKDVTSRKCFNSVNLQTCEHPVQTIDCIKKGPTVCRTYSMAHCDYHKPSPPDLKYPIYHTNYKHFLKRLSNNNASPSIKSCCVHPSSSVQYLLHHSNIPSQFSAHDNQPRSKSFVSNDLYGSNKLDRNQINKSPNKFKKRSPNQAILVTHSSTNMIKNNHNNNHSNNNMHKKQTHKLKNLTKSISCYALKFFNVTNSYVNRSGTGIGDLEKLGQLNANITTDKNCNPLRTSSNGLLTNDFDHALPSMCTNTNKLICSEYNKSSTVFEPKHSPLEFKYSNREGTCYNSLVRHSYNPYELQTNIKNDELIGKNLQDSMNNITCSKYKNTTKNKPCIFRQPIFKASTSELLKCLSFFVVAHIQLNGTDFSSTPIISTNRLRSIQPTVIVAWIRAIDKALLVQGWSEVAFINPTHIVFLYMMLKDYVQDEIGTERELHTIIMACLYLAYSYIGNEISYPLRPFLVAETNQLINNNNINCMTKRALSLNEHALTPQISENCTKSAIIDEVRNRFWQYVIRIIHEKSTDMLRINADPMLFTKMLRELKSYENCVTISMKVANRNTNRPI